MPRDAVEFAFRARDLGNDVVSPAVDRGSESDPVAAVKDLEANEKKPRRRIRGTEDGAAENATKRRLVAAIEGVKAQY